MTHKLARLADCDHTLYGDDTADLGRRMRPTRRSSPPVP